MKLSEGILGIVYSLSIVIFSLLFFDFTILIDKIMAIALFIVSIFIFIPAFKNVLFVIKCRRISKNGIRIKGKVVGIRRSLIGLKSKSKYILKVFYYNPKTHKNCYAFVGYNGEISGINGFESNKDIDIYIDPKNSNIVLIA